MVKKNSSEGLRVLHLEIEHFKNIDRRVVDIGGKSFLVVGKNNSGKSSIIQAIMSPLDRKKLPPEPVKKGEERARIQLTIGGNIKGEYKQYVVEMYFSEKNKKGTLKLFNADGEEINGPATFISSLIGEVSFDVMAWMSASKSKKLEMLKNLTQKGREIDLVNLDIKNLKAEQKYKLDRAEELQATLRNTVFTKEEIAMYMEPVDLTAIQNAQQQVFNLQRAYDDFVTKMNEQVRQRDNAVEDYKKSFVESNRISQEITRLNGLLADEEQKRNALEAERVKRETNIAKGNQWMQDNPRADASAVNTQMQNAIKHNESHNQVIFHGTQQNEMIKLKEDADGLKATMQSLVTKRNGIIAESQLPVAGLTFSDEEIFLNDFPLESEQINTATLMDVGVDIAMALNPTLKCIMLHDGSLLDEEMLRVVTDKIENHGYQAIIEIVRENESPEIIFTEEAV